MAKTKKLLTGLLLPAMIFFAGGFLVQPVAADEALDSQIKNSQAALAATQTALQNCQKDKNADCKNQEATKDKAYLELVRLSNQRFEKKQVSVGSILRVGDDDGGQTNFKNAGTFLGSVIDTLITLVGTVAFILIVAGGFRMMVAGGNDSETERAKQMITFAVIGLVVALLAYIIVATVQGVL